MARWGNNGRRARERCASARYGSRSREKSSPSPAARVRVREVVASAYPCYQRCVRLLGGARWIGLFVLTLLLAVSARADLPRQIAIRWSAPSSCPEPPSLERDVERLLGPGVGLPPTRFVAEVVQLSPRAFELTLHVESGDRTAHRTVQLASCGEVHEAAALLIATALDPTLALRAEEPQATPEPPRRPRVPLQWSLAARGLLDARSLPALSGGPSAGLGLRRDQLRIWSEGRYLFGRRARDESAGSTTQIDLFAGALGGALTWSAGKTAIGPGLEAEVGMMRGRRSTRVADEERARALWITGLAGAIAELKLTERLAFELTMFMGAPFRRVRFALRGEDPFYITRPWTFRLALGVRFSLGSL